MTWWGPGRETSDRARVDTVEVVGERSGSKRCGGGRRPAIALKLTRWEWDTSGWARVDTVEVVNELLGTKRRGGGRRRAIGV